MSVSYFKNLRSYYNFNFLNETGADLTVTSFSFPSGVALDSYTLNQWNAGRKRVIKYNETVVYGLTTSINHSMFTLRGTTMKVNYTSGDGTKLSHSVPIQTMRNFNYSMPHDVMVMLTFGNPGIPRAYKLKKRRDIINGFEYLMNDTGDVGMYLKLPSSGSPAWVLVYNDVIIAEYKSFMSVNSTIDSEGAVCSFPADASYWSSGAGVTGTLPGNQASIVNRTAYSHYAGW